MYDLFTSKFTLLKTNIRFMMPYFSLIKFGIFQFKRFLNLNYNALSYSSMSGHNSSNNLTARMKKNVTSESIFLGFKIKCVGRFSRRQRATSYWVSIGSVPLNSVNACIDYDSHGVPLAIVLL